MSCWYTIDLYWHIQNIMDTRDMHKSPNRSVGTLLFWAFQDQVGIELLACSIIQTTLSTKGQKLYVYHTLSTTATWTHPNRMQYRWEHVRPSIKSPRWGMNRSIVHRVTRHGKIRVRENDDCFKFLFQHTYLANWRYSTPPGPKVAHKPTDQIMVAVQYLHVLSGPPGLGWIWWITTRFDVIAPCINLGWKYWGDC